MILNCIWLWRQDISRSQNLILRVLIYCHNSKFKVFFEIIFIIKLIIVDEAEHFFDNFRFFHDCMEKHIKQNIYLPFKIVTFWMLFYFLKELLEMWVVIIVLLQKIYVVLNLKIIFLFFDFFGFVYDCIILVGSHDVKAHFFDYFVNPLTYAYILDVFFFFL